MTIVIMVLIALLGLGFLANNRMKEWKLGRAASETLRSVYSAQRMYLADNPTATVDSLTHELVLPYIPNSPAVMPTIESLDGAPLPIVVTSSPPFADAGGGVRYDPSGSTTDTLWDVGQ
ncbi:MAG TPA: hypothetical protein VF258_04565 [Luteolibacter sp.]